METSKYKCSICGRIYSSKNHMRRHEATHSSETRITCGFCSREFRRKDVLLRHYRSCSHRGSQPIPQARRPGRRRKACDRCARARITCSGEIPCATCKTRGLSCTYQRLRSPEKGSDSWLEGSRESNDHRLLNGANEETSRVDNKVPVPFLLNYTHPSNQTPETSNRVLTEFGPDDASHRYPETSAPGSDVDAVLSDLLFKDAWETIFDPLAMFEPHNTPSSLGLDSPHQCQLAADRMLSRLKELASAHPRYFEQFDPDEAQEFFCPNHVAEFIGAYFQQAHIPIRIIHRSCFYLGTVSTTLLLAIFLIGTICQPAENISPLTIRYADIIEWSVFEDSQFLRLMYMKQEEDPSQIAGDQLEFVQAALLVTIVQSASPSTEVRRRIRVVRVPALLAVARALSLAKVQSRWNHNHALLDHRIFIEDEMRIRTMCLAFVMDCRFVMFYNNPPYLNPLELQFDLPAGDEGIDIADDESWEPWALDQMSHGRPPSMNELMQALMCNEWTGPGNPQFGNLSIFNMLLLMLGFHSIIFGIRNSFCDMSNAQIQVDRGLTRWKALWNSCLERSSGDQIRRAGFMVQAAQDLWHYARLLLRTPTSKTGPIANDTITNVHRVLKEP